MKFTPQEISLCKQIREKHRKDVEYGDWFYSEHLREVILQSPFINIVRDQEIVNRDKNTIPLWTISDCLEFFNERAFYLEGLEQIDECEYMFSFCEMDDMGMVKGTVRSFEGKTPLEACLKAVLAVLEEGK